MASNLYNQLQHTCNRLDNYFRDIDIIEFSARPKLFNNGNDVKDMVIILDLNIKLKDDKIVDAEKITHDIKKSIEKDR